MAAELSRLASVGGNELDSGDTEAINHITEHLHGRDPVRPRNPERPACDPKLRKFGPARGQALGGLGTEVQHGRSPDSPTTAESVALWLRQHSSKIVFDVEPERRSDDRDFHPDAGAEFPEGLAEPVVMHVPARFPE